MIKKLKLSFSITILIISTVFLIGTNTAVNAEELGEQKIDAQEINIIQEVNVQESNGQEETDMNALIRYGKIDLSPEELEEEPEFVDVELLRLEDKLLEKKLIHYFQALTDVVQYKTEKNRKYIEQLREEMMISVGRITTQHERIEQIVRRHKNEQVLSKKQLTTTKNIILFLSAIGLAVAVLAYFIWRSIVNVNKNNAEVISIAENMNQRITELNNEIEMLKKGVE